MAYMMKKQPVHEYEDERKQLDTPSLASVTGAPVASTQASAAPQKAPGAGSGRFVNFGRYLDANRDVAQREGQKVVDRVEQAASGAAAAATQAKQNAELRASPIPAQAYELEPNRPRPVDTGVRTADAAKQAALAQQQMKLGTRSAAGQQALFGKSRFDSALMGAQVGGQLQQTATRYGGLSKMIADARSAEQQSDATLASQKSAADAQATQSAADQQAASEQAQLDAEARRQAQAEEDAAYAQLFTTGQVSNAYWGDDLAQQLRWRAEIDKKYGPGTYDKILNAIHRRKAAGRQY